MGRMTVGVLYGIKLSRDDIPEDLQDRFDEEMTPTRCDLRRRRDVCPRDIALDGESLFGYWVALGTGGEDYGVPGFHARKLHELSGAYVEEIKRASVRWEFFAEWARQRGVELPDPDLWITETELA